MKKLVQIQSITDVITNSSSEVFIMHQEVASTIKDEVEAGGGYCDLYEPLTMEYIERNAPEWDLWEMILVILGDNKGLVGDYERYGSLSWGWWRLDDEKWKTYFEKNKDRIQKEIVDKGYWIVEFEDHFANAWEVNEDARSYCITSKSHH